MSTHAPDAGREDRAANDQRYAALAVADDAVVIYDEANHRAWVQSTGAVPLTDAT